MLGPTVLKERAMLKTSNAIRRGATVVVLGVLAAGCAGSAAQANEMQVGGAALSFMPATAVVRPVGSPSVFHSGQVAATVEPFSSGLVCDYDVCMALFGSGLYVHPWVMSSNIPPFGCTYGRFWFKGSVFENAPRKCTGADPAVYEAEIAGFRASTGGTACNTSYAITGKPCAQIHS